MRLTEIAVVPSAFALLTAMLMFAGRTKHYAEGVSQTAAVIRVGLFLLCTIIAIAIGSSID
jgi:hypothetical protein